jgi:monovalent cation:H+ antiporter-2, CPA2 family
VIYGDATREDVLAAAMPQSARLIVVALPDAFQARRVIAIARKFHPSIETVVRTHSDEEAIYLAEEAGVGLAVMGERARPQSRSSHASDRRQGPSPRAREGSSSRRSSVHLRSRLVSATRP